MSSSSPRRALAGLVILGVGLVAAPAVFQMFSRAPLGGQMIDGFAPYMTEESIADFRGHLRTIGAAEVEVRANQLPAGALSQDWPTIDDDMSRMLTTMQDNVPRYRGVAALPPFPTFPWFFVVPGLLVAVLGVAARRRPDDVRRLAAATLVVGLGLVAAPGAFQMFTRAPGGARMIDDFRPLMTEQKVTTIQGYFLSLGAAEGQLRTETLPRRAEGLPATRRFVTDWPAISFQMAPMIGAMSDNVDNYAAVDALPDFWLFPWFFVVPGALIAGLSMVARRGATQPFVVPVPQRELATGQLT